MALILVFYGAVVPFATIPWPRIDGFIPTVEGMMSVADLVTAVFLFSQFSVSRSRELLVLASGYLFSALSLILHVATFPGAFASVNFLGAGPQSAAWIVFFWRLGFAAAIVGYVCLKDGKHAGRPIRYSTLFAVSWSVLLTTGLVCALGWFVTAGKDLLPSLMLNETALAPLAHYLAGFDLLTTLLALLFLWTHRASVLDEWLMVALCALVAELALITFFLAARFDLGFYSARLFSVLSATVVLAALLAEMARLYARLSRTLMSLQRERESKLLSLQAIGSAIAHEVNQPIAAIAWEGSTALKLLKEPPNLEEIRVSLDAIVGEAFRASEALRAVRDLFKDYEEGQTVDGNAIVVEALHLIREELKAHAILAHTELTPDLPRITGHKGQLLQVFLNLLQNAIEALDRVKDRDRIVRIATSRHGHDKISITMEDTGPGIGPEMFAKMFDAFITTKPSGTGVGLSLCRMIIERHGGEITASSSGLGARFHIILPTGESVGALRA
jgi:signal transduction histidine kinase